MFSTTHIAAKKILRLNPEKEDLPYLSDIPEHFSLSQLQILVINDHPTNQNQNPNELETLLILSSCLNEQERLEKQDDDIESIDSLSIWISKAILPDGNCVAQDEGPEDLPPSIQKQHLTHTRQKANLGISALQILLQLRSCSSSPPPPEVLLALIAFSCPLDPWTTPISHALSTTLLTNPSLKPHLLAPSFLITHLLLTILRPLFSKPKTITTAGRAAPPTTAPPPKISLPSRTSKPWKYLSPYSIPILTYLIQHTPPSTLSLNKNYTLFLPPLLTLLDEPSTPIRTRGLVLLPMFLQKLPNPEKLLRETGLGNVFENAVLPTLSYLPSITPVEESVLLLPPAYTALFTLCSVQFPNPKSEDKGKVDSYEKQRIAFLDKILREGIQTGFLHCQDQPPILLILISNLTTLITHLGINTVKHLAPIMGMLGTILTDPFANNNPELVITSVRCLQTLLLNTWPRIREERWRLEIVRVLCTVWKLDGLDEMIGARDEVLKVGKILVAVGKGDVGFKGELEQLVRVDGSLGEVFGVEVC